MRDAFIRAMERLAAAQPDVLLLSADIGAIVFDDYRARYPRQFLNVGVSEQQLVGCAAGMALTGLRPFAYTIVPFLLFRAFEQVRVDICQQRQPVVLVGVGGGVAYSTLGPTHHAIEDIAVARALPGMTVIVPASPAETEAAVAAAYALARPVYLRLGLAGEPAVPHAAAFAPGRGEVLREGADAFIIACGAMVATALQAANLLAGTGRRVGVVNMATVKPLDTGLLTRLAEHTRLFCTCEEHSLVGGLGSAVAEFAADALPGVRVLRCGLPDAYLTRCDTRAGLHAACGLDPAGVAARLAAAL